MKGVDDYMKIIDSDSKFVDEKDDNISYNV